MPDGTGQLIVKLQPAKRHADERDVLRLELQAKGVAADTTRDGLNAWFDAAHDFIVNAFLDLTSSHVQREVWERLG